MSDRQLEDLARARAEVSGGTPGRWLTRFRRHRRTAEACPDGHPEMAFAMALAPRKVLDTDYRCPACGEYPVKNMNIVERWP